MGGDASTGTTVAERCRRAQAETYRWARCREAAPLPRLRRVGLPLPEALLDVLAPALAWEDLQARPRAWLQILALSWVCWRVRWRGRRCRRARMAGSMAWCCWTAGSRAWTGGLTRAFTPCLPPLLVPAAESERKARRALVHCRRTAAFLVPAWRACALREGHGSRAQWSQLGVFVRGELFPVVRVHFARRQPPLGEAAPAEAGPTAMES